MGVVLHDGWSGTWANGWTEHTFLACRAVARVLSNGETNTWQDPLPIIFAIRSPHSSASVTPAADSGTWLSAVVR